MSVLLFRRKWNRTIKWQHKLVFIFMSFLLRNTKGTSAATIMKVTSQCESCLFRLIESKGVYESSAHKTQIPLFIIDRSKAVPVQMPGVILHALV